MILDELLKILTERNVKQKDISKALNLSQSYTSELLAGKKTMSLKTFEKLCKYLDIEVKLLDKNR